MLPWKLTKIKQSLNTKITQLKTNKKSSFKILIKIIKVYK